MSNSRECTRQEFCSECVYNCIHELDGRNHQAEMNSAVAEDRGDDEFVEPSEAYDAQAGVGDELPDEDDER